MSKIVRVAVGVILRAEEVLVAKRHEDQHQGGLWEFPGGKIEPQESASKALARELLEEVNLEVISLAQEPWLSLSHDYGDKRVELIVFIVRDFKGEAKGLEGQPLRWLKVQELETSDFPKANAVIISELKKLL
ncbi:8-oxo-dGTP diphosphatase MutT [Alginatibacterium sediminis]|uniref:8-oxo-dGTP diphosphatase n=1 Tax=Alginatibacterium sediminis TaxID=2164068 RepID=A0A420EJI0_9ALTE|nr:8-oxo-dGTP diphosphatase MutT [Alginatibacterium sediminis]RKF20859.1 8-oxo-dGTP diphosphatase MutT [Alginatibacterium sediminis]